MKNKQIIVRRIKVTKRAKNFELFLSTFDWQRKMYFSRSMMEKVCVFSEDFILRIWFTVEVDCVTEKSLNVLKLIKQWGQNHVYQAQFIAHFKCLWLTWNEHQIERRLMLVTNYRRCSTLQNNNLDEPIS